ncbi:MAG TPA: nucleotidyltransferase family protein [Halococcus sp.]|nr:nucleotidyltransferase family protein [Halococcus sp.]
MKAVVLAGGYATRLWPLTKHRPKMFLPVGNSTIIEDVFEGLETDDRIDEIYVSTNECFASEFETYLAQSGFTTPQLSVEDTTEEEEKLGVIGALAQLVQREGIDDDLFVIAGDNLISFDISDFLTEFTERGATTIAAYNVGSRERAKSYGLVELDNDRVVGFQEKPDNPSSTLVSIACYALPAEAVAFEEYLAGGNNPDEPGWFIQWLQARTPVFAHTFDSAWFDIGTRDSYLDAVKWTLDDTNLIAESATVENTDIGTGVHIMPGARVVDSVVDRSVIFPETTIDGCEIRDSVIGKQARLEDINSTGALIGAYTEVPNQ